MSARYTKVRLYELPDSSPRALHCAKTLPATLGGPVLTCWIPLSLCDHVSRRTIPDEEYPEIVVTLASWKARELNLEEVD